MNEELHAGNPCHTRTTLKIALQSHRRRVRSAAEFVADPEIAFTETWCATPLTHFPRACTRGNRRKGNEEDHGAEPVRNPFSIPVAVQRYRRRNAGARTRLIVPLNCLIHAYFQEPHRSLGNVAVVPDRSAEIFAPDYRRRNETSWTLNVP